MRPSITNRRGISGATAAGFLVVGIAIGAVGFYVATTYQTKTVYQTVTVTSFPSTTITATATVVTTTATELNDVMGQVTACSWNHTADWIEFTISATRTPSAPTDGKVMLLYIPNQHIYGPGGLFVFPSTSSQTTVVSATASDSGFDRSRSCIPGEWTPVFIE